MVPKTELIHKSFMRRLLLTITLIAVVVSCSPIKPNKNNGRFQQTDGGVIVGEMSASQRKAAEDLTRKSAGDAEVFVKNGVVRSVLTDASESFGLNAEQTISNYFSENAALYQITDFNKSFVLKDHYQLEDGSQVFSYQQIQDGIPVYLANIRVSLDETGVVSLVNSNYLPQANLFKSSTPKMDSIAAREAFSKTGYQVLEGMEPELVIFTPLMINKTGKPFLAWHAKVTGDGFYGSVLIKDSNKSVVTTSTDIQTLDHEIRSFNGKVIPDTDLDSFKAFESYDLLPESEENGRASHLHQYLRIIKAYYADEFNYTNIEKAQSKIRVAIDLKLTKNDGTLHDAFAVNLVDNHENKYGIIGFSLESYEKPIDTIAHEFQHIVTNDFVTLLHGKDYPEPSALSEAISDFFGAVLDYDGNPWQIHGGTSLVRDIENAGTGNFLVRIPAHMDDYRKPSFWNKSIDGYSYGFGHHNSTIISHALYLLTEGGVGKGKDKILVSGIGINNSAQIVFHSLNRLEDNAGFGEARNTMVETCENLAKRGKLHFDNCNQVKNAFAAVGIGDPAKQSLVGPVPNEPVKTEFDKIPIYSLGIDDYFFLTFNKKLWYSRESTFAPGHFSLVLEQDPKCLVSSYSIADGPGISTRTESREFFGEFYRIVTFTNGGKDFMELIHRGRFEEFDAKGHVAMTLELGKNPVLCREYFWDVIELSQKDNFGLGNDKESNLEPVDMGDGFTLFVDPNVWAWEADQSPLANVRLYSKLYSECQMNTMIGIVNHDLYVEEVQKFRIADTTFNQVIRRNKSNNLISASTFSFTYMNRGEIVNVIAGQNEDSNKCIQLAIDVLRDSESKGFGLQLREVVSEISSIKLPQITFGKQPYLSYEINVWDVYTWSHGNIDLVAVNIPDCRIETGWSACNPHANKHNFITSTQTFLGTEYQVEICTQKASGDRVGKIYTIKLDGGEWAIVAHGFFYDIQEERPLSDACIQAADHVIELSAQNGFNK